MAFSASSSISPNCSSVRIAAPRARFLSSTPPAWAQCGHKHNLSARSHECLVILAQGSLAQQTIGYHPKTMSSEGKDGSFCLTVHGSLRAPLLTALALVTLDCMTNGADCAEEAKVRHQSHERFVAERFATRAMALCLTRVNMGDRMAIELIPPPLPSQFPESSGPIGPVINGYVREALGNHFTHTGDSCFPPRGQDGHSNRRPPDLVGNASKNFPRGRGIG